VVDLETGLVLSFCFRGGSGCEDILLEIALLDMIFNVLTERPTLSSLMSPLVMKRAVFLLFGTRRIMWVLDASPRVDP